jgi:methylmalonyl-CoA mutase N-terminal domain/subunit
MKTADNGAGPKPAREYTTISGHPVREIYTPADLEGFDHAEQLGEPGAFPFTRGVCRNMYRERLWGMHQFGGGGEAGDANGQLKRLLQEGQTELSVAFDHPTLLGYDSDRPESSAEVGRCGVAIDSLADMETLFNGIRLDQVTVSLAASAPAAMLWAMYLAAAEKQGADWKDLSGTIQNDILQEYIAHKDFLYPPCPSMRLVTDVMAFGRWHVPRWHTISVGGYAIREAGATAIQELAFALRDGVEYVDFGIRAGLKLDDFAPHLSFFFDVHSDFFEEIAKLRAARRIWARTLQERFGAREDGALLCRIHCRTAGASLTAQQPYNNVVRVALQALAAVLGGTQSLHANSLDDILALPTEKSITMAQRTQQIIAHESGIPETVDPLGGSYFLEALTGEMEAGARAYMARIDAMGGMVPAIERGFPQREIQEASCRHAQSIERKGKIVVGVNEFNAENQPPPDALAADDTPWQRRCAELKKLRAGRGHDLVARNLSALKRAAEGADNLMLPILDCVRSYATLGEICDALRTVYGEYREPGIP